MPSGGMELVREISVSYQDDFPNSLSCPKMNGAECPWFPVGTCKVEAGWPLVSVAGDKTPGITLHGTLDWRGCKVLSQRAVCVLHACAHNMLS